MSRPKKITMCGSSKFTDIMAVCSWLLERDEQAIVIGLHLLPVWYPDCPEHHLAEHEGVADQMDNLHLKKIDFSNEIFVVNYNNYIGKSTAREIKHAESIPFLKVRYFTSDPIGEKVQIMIKAFLDKKISTITKSALDIMSHISGWKGHNLKKYNPEFQADMEKTITELLQKI